MGAEKILDKILADAKTDYDKIISQAEETVLAKKNEQAKITEKEIEKISDDSKKESEENERRMMLNASLDARKNSLSAKREVLDGAFARAKEMIDEFSDEKYISLLCSIIIDSHALGDEQVFVSENDQKRFSVSDKAKSKKIIDDINKKIKAGGKEGTLSIGGTTSKVKSGVLLSGEITDIDCSFESVMARFREENEAKVAALLFESEV